MTPQQGSTLQGIIEALMKNDQQLLQFFGTLATALLCFLLALISKRQKNVRLALVLAVLGGFFLVAAPFILANKGLDRAICLFAAAPAAVILNHALLLYFVRRRVMPGNASEVRARIQPGSSRALFDAEVLANAVAATQRYFSAEVVALRYVPAALGVFAITLKCANLIVDQNAAPWTELPGLRAPMAFGLAGAYVYVCLLLGQRSFQSDITQGTAIWCVFTLLAGPILAVLTSLLVLDPKVTGVSFKYSVILFSAGFSPRLVVSLLEGATKRLYFGSSAAVPAVTARTIPLGAVRGIDSNVQTRMEEEGIYDCHTLATADPIRLLRNTAFDKRQIAGWIDNALLLSTLYEHRDLLEKQGITGATDLALYGANLRKAGAIAPPGLQKLAELTRMDLALLSDVALRLWEDAQVRLILLLYQVEGDGSRESTTLDDQLIRAIAWHESETAADSDSRERQQALIVQAARQLRVTDTAALEVELNGIARAYEGVRSAMPSSGARTVEMTHLLARARVIGRALGLKSESILEYFKRNQDGDRVVALALARDVPDPGLLAMILECIENSRSAFEQFHALAAARELQGKLDAAATAKLAEAVRQQMKPPGHIASGTDRELIARDLLGAERQSKLPASLPAPPSGKNGEPAPLGLTAPRDRADEAKRAAGKAAERAD